MVVLLDILDLSNEYICKILLLTCTLQIKIASIQLLTWFWNFLFLLIQCWELGFGNPQVHKVYTNSLWCIHSNQLGKYRSSFYQKTFCDFSHQTTTMRHDRRCRQLLPLAPRHRQSPQLCLIFEMYWHGYAVKEVWKNRELFHL